MKSGGSKGPGSGGNVRFVLVARFPEPWQADMAVSLLASEGISACPADEMVESRLTRRAAIGGSGVVVSEAEAPFALEILRMAEGGELSLPDDGPSGEWNLDRMKGESPLPGRRGIQPGSGETEVNADPLVRCPRCGSRNVERKTGLMALFPGGWRCKVCRWEWRGRQNRPWSGP